MKTYRILIVLLFSSLIFSCSEKEMDDINKEVNNALDMDAKNMIPDAELKTAFEVAGTDIAWYATVYIEHSAGTWAQSATADKRIGQNDPSLFNNNWVSIYNVLNICKEVISKTEATGSEPYNFGSRGIAQAFTAYNLGVLTDMWGDVPWSEALKGIANMQPKFDKQQDIYPAIIDYLDSAIVNFGKAKIWLADSIGHKDYIYRGDMDLWTKAAYSLKARYALRLLNVDANAASKALESIPLGFTGNNENFMFSSYEATATGENPWYQFLNDRTHLSAGQTLYDMMFERNDPRIAAY